MYPMIVINCQTDPRRANPVQPRHGFDHRKEKDFPGLFHFYFDFRLAVIMVKRALLLAIFAFLSLCEGCPYQRDKRALRGEGAK